MRIILNTGVFFHPEALAMLKWYAAPVVVPAVVYAERCRQIKRGGGDVDRFARLLESFGATIEPLDAEAASRYTLEMTDDERWARLARDALIAGHVRPGDRLFTTNMRDFVEVGVPVKQIVEIPSWRTRERAARPAESTVTSML